MNFSISNFKFFISIDIVYLSIKFGQPLIFFLFHRNKILRDDFASMYQNSVLRDWQWHLWPSVATAENVTRDLLSLANRGKSETRWDESRLPRRVGTRFEGVFLHGGSFNAITRATPGASPSCLCPSFPALHGTLKPPLPLPSFPQLTPLALSSFVAATLTTATHHFLAHEPTLARTLSLSVFHHLPPRPLAPTPSLPPLTAPSPSRHTLPSPRTSFRIIFILSSAILVNAIPPVVREPFFILRLNILSRYRAVETSRLEDGEGGRKRDDTPEPDGVALCFRAIKILSASPWNRRGMSSSELRKDSLARYRCRARKHNLFILV